MLITGIGSRFDIYLVVEFDVRTFRQTTLFLCVISTFFYIYLYTQSYHASNTLSETIDNSNVKRRNYRFNSSKLITTKIPNTNYLYNVTLKHNDVPNENKAILTLFTSWVSTPEKYSCHNNTLFNWNSLKPFVQPILFTNDAAAKSEAIGKGWKVLPVRVTRTKYKVPVLRYMYMDAMNISDTPFLAFANGDILFTSNLIITLQSLLNALKTSALNQTTPVLMIGQRTNVKNVTLEEIRTPYKMQLLAKKRGKLFSAWGEDYFITSRNYPWKTLPDVIIGRLAYDNWMVWNAKRLKFTTIDATKTLLAIHQTTKSGNMEGHSKPDNKYNKNLLRKTYKKLKYIAGLTLCADYFARYGSKSVLFLKRKLHKRCIP